MKTIIILHKSKVSSFPPLLSLIQVLKVLKINVVLICSQHDDPLFLKRLEEYCFKIHLVDIKIGKNKFEKALSWYKTRKLFWEIIENNDYSKEFLWIPTADTTLALGKKLLRHKYILNLFELFDMYPYYQKNLKIYAQNAQLVICPEINRAHILKVWYQLKKLPFILENKPFDNIRGRNLTLPSELEDKINKLKAHNKKIAIYQGIMSNDRGLEELCSLFDKSGSFILLMMGATTKFSQELEKKYKNVVFIPFVAPPYHLHITSHADVGILTYDESSLNNIYCAPNKIWEYSAIGLPMLGNNIPGLINVINQNNLGKCCDFNNILEVDKNLNYILKNYEELSLNSSKFYNTVDVKNKIEDIISQCKI
ncbi:hypothetical protein N5D03_02430 [Empedobacter sp. GD03861]|uniref:hypothetical protein n=1 Tax=Empedobacter sp. GD03861 TaxID=2975390 RepID=UPI0024484989|nr:hypothetical protein [Empedobacter sp. GD03861]MDH0673398.1 hypothetical protein [Empedobacter sp. GD03861]